MDNANNPTNAVAMMRQMLGDQMREMVRLHGERIAAETGNTINYDLMKTTIIQTVMGYGCNDKTLPRGYKVLGGVKTGYYLAQGGAATKLNSEQFVMDLVTGLMGEINEFLQKELMAYTKGQAR